MGAPGLLCLMEPGALGGGVYGVPVLLCFVSLKKERERKRFYFSSEV